MTDSQLLFICLYLIFFRPSFVLLATSGIASVWSAVGLLWVDVVDRSRRYQASCPSAKRTSPRFIWTCTFSRIPLNYGEFIAPIARAV